MVKGIQVSLVSHRERLRYGFGAVCIGIIALLFLFSFHGGAAQGLVAPVAPNAITIDKSSVTSVEETYNAINQAVAGELVTVTVVYNVSDQTIYDASPRVMLQDGLYPTGSSPTWSEMHTGVRNDLLPYEPLIPSGRNGALIIFPDQAVITGTDAITVEVYAVRTQYQYVGTAEIGHGTGLRIQAVLRYCDTPGCTTKTAVSDDSTDARVYAIRPDIGVATSPTYLDAAGVGAGDGQVRLTFNTTNSSGRPTAYDIVFTATLGSGLTYDASSSGDGAGSGTVSTVGGITYVAWNVPVSLASGVGWQAVITATLPPTFTIGTEFDRGAQVIYETFAGDVPDEGVYTNVETMAPLLPGITHSKHSNLPTGTDIRIGEMLTYTVMFVQGANTSLPSPYYIDDLPLGFHYISGTLDVQGGAVVTDVTVTAGALSSGFTKERLSWFMESMPVSASARSITAVYEVHNTGLDYDGELVWAASSDFTSFRASPNSAVLNWHPPVGIPVSSLAVASASVDVFQPYLANTTYFKTSRTDGQSYDREVGQLVRFKLEFRNTGRAPAYEVELCDQLPAGTVLNTTTLGNIVYSANFPQRLVEPQEGDNLLCWELDVVPIGTTYSAEYWAEILGTVMPGVPLVNNLYLVDYTSMPGDIPGERHYGEIPAAIPQAQFCADPAAGCLAVLGLMVDKTPWQTNAGPADFVTYTLSYQDTSAQFDYQDVVLTDNFDVDLASFVDAIPAPTQPSAGQLVWDVGDLADTSGTITLTMQVAEVVPDGVYELPNVLSWESTEIPLHTITRTVGLQAANLNLAMYGPAHVHADEDIVYTVEYSNTGSAVTSTVVLTLDYGPYVEFVSSSPLTPRSGTDNVFDDTVPNTEINHTLTVNLRVKAPLPYGLAGPLVASALLESPGAETKQANISMILDRPVLVLEKIGPELAPSVGNILEYTIRVQNQGSYTATGVMVTDTWGSYLGYGAANVAFGWTLSGDGTYATQSLGDLDIGEVVTRLFQMIVQDTATFYTNTVTMTSDQTTQQIDTEYTWQSSIATTKSATPVPAFPGRVLTYTVYYTSTATFPMVTARITDTLPADFVYQGQSTAHADGCQTSWGFVAPAGGGGGEAVWTCATLLSGASGHFLIWGLVETDAEGTFLENTTTTSATDIPARPIENPLLTRVARPWLRVDKTAIPIYPVAPGDLVTYTLTYENYGTDPAYNVVISDVLPTQVDFESCSGGCTPGSTAIWNIPVVPTDTVGSLQLVAQVKAGTYGQTAVNETYTIRSDRLPINETITGDATTTPILESHVSVTKLAATTLVTQVNAPITYTIHYTNDGGGMLTNLTLADELSAMTTFSWASPGCHWTGSGLGGVVTCDLGNLAQGAQGTVEIIVLAGVQGLITNTAVIDSDQTAPLETDPPTEVFYYTGSCIPPYNVGFTVSANPTAGQVVTFTGTASGDPPLTYTWSFGDAQGGEGQVVNHTYAVSNTYVVRLTVANPCNEAGVNVQKSVYVPGAPELSWNPASLSKTTDPGSLAVLSDTLTVSNVGTNNLQWSIEVTPAATSWLSVAVGGPPAKVLFGFDTAPDDHVEVTVYFDPAGLAGGVYNASLRITSNDADEGVVDIPVSFTYDPGAAEIAWHPAYLSRSAEEGATDVLSSSLTITNAGTIDLQWTIEITPTVSWLRFTVNGSPETVYLPDLTTAPGAQMPVTVIFNPTGLAEGVYNTSLRITSNDEGEGVVLVPVSFTVIKSNYYIYLPLVVRNYQ